MSIFVFGSNLAGVHGAGAAHFAYKVKGAIWGQGVGHYGDSFAIPTKDHKIQTLPLDTICYFVDMFVEYARISPEVQFKVTRVGCGLAGLKDADVAPLFKNAGNNCQFDTAWEEYLPGKKFWGTF
jgi:hypothetical protein